MSLKGVKVLALLTNIRLYWRVLLGTNIILFGFVKAYLHVRFQRSISYYASTFVRNTVIFPLIGMP